MGAKSSAHPSLQFSHLTKGHRFLETPSNLSLWNLDAERTPRALYAAIPES